LKLPATARVVSLEAMRARAPERLEDASDDALVEALRAGASRAPAVFFDRFAPVVERIIYRILGSDADRAEPLNDTFCRALDRLDALVDPRGVRPWLVAIAVNVAREQLRARRRRSWLLFAPTEELPDRPAESPLDAREAAQHVFAVMERLPEDERIAFALKHLEGLAPPEIAEALGTSLATAKRLVVRAEERFFKLTSRDAVLASWRNR
jgi:RNA polymerase sigma-70 factor (ECF subfamily)